jgi:hypothetical protein
MGTPLTYTTAADAVTLTVDLVKLGIPRVSGACKVLAMSENDLALDARGVKINGVAFYVAGMDLRLDADRRTWVADYRSVYLRRADYQDTSRAAYKAWDGVAAAIAGLLSDNSDELAALIMSGKRAGYTDAARTKRTTIEKLLQQITHLETDLDEISAALASFSQPTTAKQLVMARDIAANGHAFRVALDAARQIEK